MLVCMKFYEYGRSKVKIYHIVALSTHSKIVKNALKHNYMTMFLLGFHTRAIGRDIEKH